MSKKESTSVIYLRDLSSSLNSKIEVVQKELNTSVRTKAVKHMIREYSNHKAKIESLEKELLDMKHQNRLLVDKLSTVKRFFSLINDL